MQATFTCEILIVDDNPGDITLLQQAFKSCEFHPNVCGFVDSRKALDYLQAQNWKTALHVIILDLNMPKIHGFQILEEIRKHREMDSIPILVLTSSRADGDLKRCRELGADFYLVKPIALTDLINLADAMKNACSENKFCAKSFSKKLQEQNFPHL
jgi:CheY-like chemotaxis protein